MIKAGGTPRTEQAGRPTDDSQVLITGALERHPRFEEVRQAYNEWLHALPEAERGSPGQRNWRARCTNKACSLLWARIGRMTTAAVMHIIGFGSATSVNSDVKAWLSKAPRRDALIDLSGLIESPALQEAFESALQMLLAAAQTAARQEAAVSLEAERTEMASAIGSMQEDLEIAEQNRQQSQSQAVELEGLLGSKTVELDRVATEVAALAGRVSALNAELIESARVVGEAQAQARMAGEQLQRETRRADDLQADLSKRDESVRANEKMREQVLKSALARPGLVSVMRDNEATLEVDGDTLPRVWLARAGMTITPTFDSLFELEAFCHDFRTDLAEFTARIPVRAFWSQDSQGRISTPVKKAGPAAHRSNKAQAQALGKGT